MNKQIKNSLFYLTIFIASSYGFSRFQTGGGTPQFATASTGKILPGKSETLLIKIDAFMKKYVTKQGLVKYDLIRKDTSLLKEVMNQLSKKYTFKTHQQKKTFYINAYNMVTINQVITHWPIKKITSSRGFFNRMQSAVNGQSITLDHIEQHKLRPMKDPRIHSAIVCGAISCPPLQNQAYTPKNVEQLLDQNTKRWVNDPTKNKAAGGKLWLSKIFKWYASDFKHKPYHGVASFLKAYASKQSGIAKLLKEKNNPSVSYQDYDWSLNQAP